MFSCDRAIRMEETDATGSIYFANLSKIGLEVFEEWAHSRGFSLKKRLEFQDFLLPIVHSEATFLAPIVFGDELKVQFSITRIGTSSFTHCSKFLLDGKEVGRTSITHVITSPETKKSMPIPKDLLILLMDK